MEGKEKEKEKEEAKRTMIMKINKLKETPQEISQEDAKRQEAYNMSPRVRGGSGSAGMGKSSSVRLNCLCAPTTHPGSFRCRYHRRNSALGIQRILSSSTLAAASLSPSLLPPTPAPNQRVRLIIMAETTQMEIETATKAVPLPAKPVFKPLKAHEMSDGKVQFRKIPVPPNRYTPLKKAWLDIYTPVYDQMKVDIRMNLKSRKVELKTRADTPDVSNLQKSADFVHAFMLGFDIPDAVALLRMDELYVESFEIKDVKTLKGEHLSRAIGRLSGKGGKTKFAIENSTKTRIVIADTRIHILGAFTNIKVARSSLCSLIMGSPAGKVYSKLRNVSARLAD
ncbi:hypothetical protein IGI04_020545 [Brassica rapa subsp. trilocularis]|uniref:K Homology domain-containing protein n=2 Tax=Brassica TaxID=3705 RepID=A0ABQ7MJ07_BRACM|nr:hypothetical protein IGI04_020545 [Brassica rapa subsp. trilocularis]